MAYTFACFKCDGQAIMIVNSVIKCWVYVFKVELGTFMCPACLYSVLFHDDSSFSDSDQC